MDDKDTLLRGAKAFASRYTHLSAEDQRTALSARHPRDLQRIAGDGAEELFQNLEAFRQLESEGFNFTLTQASAQNNKPSAASNRASGAIAGAGLVAAAGAQSLMEDKSYEGYKKSFKKMAEDAGKQWEKEEERLKKEEEEFRKKGKTPPERDPNRFTSKEEYMDSHLRTSHDYLASTDPKKAKKWAQEHPEDMHLSRAIDRMAVFDKKLTFEEFKQIRQRYIEKAAIAGATPEQTIELQARAASEMNNLLVSANPELAKKGATLHGDRGLTTAHNANRQRQIDYAKKNQSRISKLLGRDPIKEFGEEIKLSEESGASAAQSQQSPSAPQVAQAAAVGAATANYSNGDESMEEMEPDVPPPPPPMSTKPMPKMPPYPSDTKPTPPPPSPTRGKPRRGISAGALPGASGAKKAMKAAGFLAKLAANDPRAWAKLIGAFIGAFLIIFLFMLAYIWVNACEIAGQYPWGQDLLQALAKRDCASDNPSGVPPPPEGVTIIKEAVDENGDKIESIANRKPITYVIKVTYNPDEATVPLNDLILFDRPDFDFDLVSATEPYTPRTDAIGPIISWGLSDHNSDGDNNFEFRLVVLPKQEDFKAINRAFFNEEAAPSGDLMVGADAAPSDNTCGGKYNTKNNLNFGDPVCSYTPAKFSAYIKEVDPNANNWEFWEDISISEGSSPNIGGNINSLGGGGSGTFQMYPSDTIDNHGLNGKSWPPPSNVSNPPHGDVTWQRQIQQAVGWNNYLSRVNRKFVYWGTAYCLCYFDSYRNSHKGWCNDIIRLKATRCPYQCDPNSCSIYTDRLAKKRGNAVNCRQYRCNIGKTGRDANTDKPWN